MKRDCRLRIANGNFSPPYSRGGRGGVDCLATSVMVQPPPTPPRIRGGVWRGFTLLEVLVALGLSIFLLAAVYSALDLHFKYTTAGQAEVQQAALARAILHRIEIDIRSVLYQEEPPAATTTDAAAGDAAAGDAAAADAGATTSTTTEATMIEDPMDAYNSTTTGLFGSASSLLMHISKPSRQMHLLGNYARMSDLVTVNYVLDPTVGGLTRLEGDRMAINMAKQSGNAGTVAKNTELLATEVVGLRFAYFDGYTWAPAWDSLYYAGLPRAVAIELDLASTSSVQSNLSGTQATGTTAPAVQVYRLVVAIPVSKPIDPNAQL